MSFPNSTGPNSTGPNSTGPSLTGPAPTGPRPVPVDVGTAFQLWWGVAACGLVNLLASLWAVLGDRDKYASQLREDMLARDPKAGLSEGTVNILFVGSLGVAVVLGILIAAVVLLIAHLMRKGRNWARQVLTFIGLLLVFFAVPPLLGLGADNGTVGWIAGAAGIVQAVLAAGSIFLMHRKSSNGYFLPQARGPRP